ncbi:hypothetical protein ALC62_10533 [Cyphomyrmex costatus]|uniref:Gustatory receptor n=1 Tax=Cyphomyrmex costatus TaxID=456900 RepID=A0A195CEA8_9HYME|nr:hypothetical protein ALC62_10533 [Cyphomyrmex costatus]
MILVSSILLTLVNLFRFKDFKECLNELSIVDDTLEALDVPKEYQRLHYWIIRIIIGFIVYIFADLTTTFYMLYLYEIDINFTIIFTIFVNYYPVYVTILSALIWGTIFRYISSRFHRINDGLHVFCSNLSKINTDYRRQNIFILVRQLVTEAKDYKQHMWIIM